MINDIGLLYCVGLEKDVNFMKNFISAIIITGVGLVTMATGVYASPVSDALRNGVNNKATEVDVSSCGLTVNQANTEYTDFVCSDDKAWMLQNVAKYEVSGDKVVKVILDYKYDKSEIANKQKEIDSVVNSIVSSAKSCKTDYDKAKFVYDYLVDNFKYDNTLSNQTTYDLYTKKSGTCKTFALAYKEILTKLNVSCDVVVSKAMAHEWNVVKMGNAWYNIDVSGANILSGNRDDFFLKSEMFYNILGYNGGTIINGITVSKTDNYNA